MAAPESATAPEASVPETTRGQRRAVAIVIAVVFVDLLGFGVVIPILPYYVRSFGVTDVVIGLLAASYSMMQFLFAPTLGRLSDEHGRRPVIMLSLVGSVVAWIVFGLAGQFDATFGLVAGLLTLFASRMVAGAMGGNIAAAQAYVADVTPVERRAGALGLLGASFSLGFIFGPAIGGVMASDAVVAGARALLPAAVPATRFSLPSFAAAGLSLLALGAATFALPEPERTRRAGERTSLLGGFAAALRDADLRGLVIAFFVLSVAFSGVQVMFIPFVADVYGFDATNAALLLTYVGVLGALNQGVLVGQLSRRYSPVRIAIAGAAILVVGFGAMPFSPAIGEALLPAVGPLGPALLALLVVLGLFAVGNGLVNVALATLVSIGATEDTQGSAFGVTQGAGSLGRTIGPPVMAALYVLARPTPFVVGALLVVPIVALLGGMARGSARGG